MGFSVRKVDNIVFNSCSNTAIVKIDPLLSQIDGQGDHGIVFFSDSISSRTNFATWKIVFSSLFSLHKSLYFFHEINNSSITVSFSILSR